MGGLETTGSASASASTCSAQRERNRSRSRSRDRDAPRPRDGLPAKAAAATASTVAVVAPAAPLDGIAADQLPWHCNLKLMRGLVFGDSATTMQQARLESIDSRTSDVSVLRRRMVVRLLLPRPSHSVSASSSDAELRADLEFVVAMLRQGIAQPAEIEWAARIVPCEWSRNLPHVLVQLRPASCSSAATDVGARVHAFSEANRSRPESLKLASWFTVDCSHLSLFAIGTGFRFPCRHHFTRRVAADKCKFQSTRTGCLDGHSVAEARALMEKERRSRSRRSNDRLLLQA